MVVVQATRCHSQPPACTGAAVVTPCAVCCTVIAGWVKLKSSLTEHAHGVARWSAEQVVAAGQQVREL